MQAADRSKSPSVTEIARRAQIVDAAVDVIAEIGVDKASFSAIAKHAGLSSTSLISYHFAGRADLIQSVAEHIRRDLSDFVTSRLDESSPARTVITFCEASVDSIRERPASIRALRGLLGSTEGAEAGEPGLARDRDRLADVLRNGQRTGDFREFDAITVASFLLALRNDIIRRWMTEPQVDVERCREELTTVAELVTTKYRTKGTP